MAHKDSHTCMDYVCAWNTSTAVEMKVTADANTAEFVDIVAVAIGYRGIMPDTMPSSALSYSKRCKHNGYRYRHTTLAFALPGLAIAQ